MELKKAQPDGSEWNTEAQDKLASKWSAVRMCDIPVNHV